MSKKRHAIGVRTNEEVEANLALLLKAFPGENNNSLLRRLLRERAMRVQRMKHPGKVSLKSSSDGSWNIKLQCRVDRDEWVYCGWVDGDKTIHLDLDELLDAPFGADIKQVFQAQTEEELEKVLLFDIQMLLPS